MASLYFRKGDGCFFFFDFPKGAMLDRLGWRKKKTYGRIIVDGKRGWEPFMHVRYTIWVV